MDEYVCELPVEGMVSFMSGGVLIPVHERIVRCRDCERFSVDNSDHDYRSGWWCKRWNTDMVKPDGFCAWACRKEEDE